MAPALSSRRTPDTLRVEGNHGGTEGPAIIELHNVCKNSSPSSSEPLPVLKDIDDLAIADRRCSGCSPLRMRKIDPATHRRRPHGERCSILGHLLPPANGRGVRTFSLYPWLTVLNNIDALDALKLYRTRKTPMSAIDLIGLDGFQSAIRASFPAEVVAERVGFGKGACKRSDIASHGRAVLGARRADGRNSCGPTFSYTWIEHHLPTKGMLMVTSNMGTNCLCVTGFWCSAQNPGHIAAPRCQCPLPPRQAQPARPGIPPW